MKCLIVSGDPVNRVIVEDFIAQTIPLEFLQSFVSVEDSSRYLIDHKPNIVFLDVSVRGMIDLHYMRQCVDHSVQLIVLSNGNELAKEAFDNDATDFLVSPFKKERLMQSVLKAWRLHLCYDSEQKNDNSLFIKISTRLVKIRFMDIYFMQSTGDYLTLHTVEKKLIVHESLKNILDVLPHSLFVRVHQSYIVNVQHIKALENGDVLVKDERIPVGRRYKDELLGQLKIL